MPDYNAGSSIGPGALGKVAISGNAHNGRDNLGRKLLLLVLALGAGRWPCTCPGATADSQQPPSLIKTQQPGEMHKAGVYFKFELLFYLEDHRRKKSYLVASFSQCEEHSI